MYKIAISDLDGTLLGPNHRMSKQTKESIHRWLHADRKFAIATGRHHLEAINVQNELNEPTYLISSNGARVHNKEGEVILKQNLPAPIAQFICDIEFDAEVQVNLYTETQWHSNFVIEELADSNLGKNFKQQVSDLKAIDKSEIIKIVFWGDNKKLTPIYEQLQQLLTGKVNLTFSLPQCLEVMDVNTNKATALQVLLKHKNLTMADTIAFGDGMNDVEMLKEVGKPILMANSQKQLIEAIAGAEMTVSSKEHGVAVKLDALLNQSN